jgi:predicted short-subunit dehydrogenase-like oxidoreductase (DUF2520 family)
MAHPAGALGPAPPGCAAFHLSAALSTDVLAPLHMQGYEVGSFHPLQAVAHPVSAAGRIPGSYVAVVASPEALAVARRLTTAMGSPLLHVPAGRRPLFHAAIVLAAGYLPPLLDLAARLMERAGVDSEDALAALIPLVRGTLADVEERGLRASVTGPIASGDAETVSLHLRAMEPEDARMYSMFGTELLRLVEGGLDEPSRHELSEQFAKYR